MQQPTILIRVHKNTAEKLSNLGKFGDSYDSVITKLLEKKK